jgi:hypothetical protein
VHRDAFQTAGNGKSALAGVCGERAQSDFDEAIQLKGLFFTTEASNENQ